MWEKQFHFQGIITELDRRNFNKIHIMEYPKQAIYWKLVRDLIPETIKANDAKPIFHIANKSEYWDKLREKLQEEVREVINAKNTSDLKKELADLLEVMYAILANEWINMAEIEQERISKRIKRWWFEWRIILEETK